MAAIKVKELVFYYDVICPYAYLASRLVEDVAVKTGTVIKWRPVLLGGIYKATRPSNDTSFVMNDTKLNIIRKDLIRLYQRHNVPANPWKSIPDISTLNAMRLIAASPGDASELRKKLTHRLYYELWVKQKDVSDADVLRNVAADLNWDVDVKSIISGEIPDGKTALIDNTAEAIKNGAFGVPSFWLNNKLYFGADRLHFVERDLGKADAVPTRIVSAPVHSSEKRKLTIFHDFASPWSFIGSKQIENILKTVSPVDVDVEWVPILIGALFKEIGTPFVPMMGAGENKKKYAFRDIYDWCDYLGISFHFPSTFPMMTLSALRLSIANTDEKLRNALYDAAWSFDQDLGNKEVLHDILTKAGYDADSVMQSTNNTQVKEQLKKNTARALDAGVCGLPSYQVDDGPVIWGQDRLNIVADLLCGWKDNTDELTFSKL